MTPDEVIIELESIKNFIKEYHCTMNIEALSSAISLIQDYQKLRERVSVDKHCKYQRLYPRCALDQTICDEEDCKKRKV